MATTEAFVTVGEVTIDDTLGKYVDLGDDPGIFIDYEINNHYEGDCHRYMMGITSPDGFQGGKAAFVQLAAPTLLWISDWTSCRFKDYPPIPDPDVQNANWILLDKHYEPAMVTVGPDGVTCLYRISGTYVYGHKNPSNVTVNDINHGRPPWLLDDCPRTVSTEVLTQGIINVVGGGTVTTGGDEASPGEVGIVTTPGETG